jgi:transposase
MAKRPHTDAKQDALRQNGALHPHPERVRDPLFAGDELFDPRDLVQVKYEMIRRARVEQQAVTEACASFGLSRPVFYRSQKALEREGLPGLVAKKRGPRGAHKLTEEVMGFIAKELEEDQSLAAGTVAQLLRKRLGVKVHPRSIERALARRQKKAR